MGEAEIRDFLTHLASDRNVAASTQNDLLVPDELALRDS
jgi:hypothetical protein